MSCPLEGEVVQIRYMEVNDLEAMCWIEPHSCVGYVDNSDFKIRLDDIGDIDVGTVISTEDDRIELKVERY